MRRLTKKKRCCFGHALVTAKAVVDGSDRVRLSARDSLRVLDLMQTPPAPNHRLLAAAKTLPAKTHHLEVFDWGA